VLDVADRVVVEREQDSRAARLVEVVEPENASAAFENQLEMGLESGGINRQAAGTSRIREHFVVAEGHHGVLPGERRHESRKGAGDVFQDHGALRTRKPNRGGSTANVAV